MLQLKNNPKVLRYERSHKMITALQKRDDLVKVQRDELNRLYHLNRSLQKEEREYIVRLYQDKLGAKKSSKPNCSDIYKEREITNIEDISFLN